MGKHKNVMAVTAPGLRPANIDHGTLSDPNSVIVSAQMVGSTITLVIDATVAAATPALGATWVIPLVDPSGQLIDGWPWFPPSYWIEVISAPTAASGVCILAGIVDGTDITTNQHCGGGLLYDNATGPKPRAFEQGAGALTGSAVAGGAFASVGYSHRIGIVGASSLFLSKAYIGCTTVRTGGDGAGTISTPNDEYGNVPHIFISVTADGTSADTTMAVSFKVGYNAAMKMDSLTVPG